MKVLITGCLGQVGHCLTEQLHSRSNVELLALDRDDLDITDRGMVLECVRQFNPDIIINAAAHTAVDKAEGDVELSYAINRDGPQFLAQAAQNVGAALLHISTDYVFTGNKEGEYGEVDLAEPQSVYGQSKLAGEQAVIAACDKYIILRTAWVFSEHGNNFVKTMLKLAQTRDELGIIGDQVGGPTYAGDIATALIQVADVMYMKSHLGESCEAISGIYHFSGSPHVSWYEFAKVIFAAASEHQVLSFLPKVNEITAAQYPLPAPRPANSKLNCQKINDVFNITPSNWQKALQRIAEYK
ncbi:dTDP-4-dehydrorhamnose reductase [Vibrio aestuarianus]|nr:dTDP-4-dehydrorhamnose reductase [Vibrio aestuarianus]